MFILAKCPQTTILVNFYNNCGGVVSGIKMLFQSINLQKVQKFSLIHALILELIVAHRISKLAYVGY